ncbi:Tol-Pal system protein TolB [Uliginosibacterium sp. IMCC34675]|uniref:Tol-Pal system protein TolB n=2 Tax=Zoogloeaceae TaxID=2008794 RepID=A0ABX2IM26_9RHOO|nr:Tol-Pal system protein TolB [Uliginosibacterium aquaticum]PLK50943.1 Tol-Pal system beta propeller repeat protein TolB [Uliginosibacterium sp. TH139]
MKLIRTLIVLGSALAGLLLSPLASAQLNVEIYGAGADRIPVAVSSFAGEGLMQGGGVTAIVRKDLELSGLFRMIDTGATAEGLRPDLPGWRGRGADAVLVGSMSPGAGGLVDVRFSLFDAPRNTELFALKVSVNPNQARPLGHHIANKVYEKLIGQPGIFSTRIAYVEKRGQTYDLVIADFDGENQHRPVTLQEPIMSPVWSPDGRQLAFVDFHSRKPIVKVLTLETGAVKVIANYRGSNSAPAWSPDGRRLALTLTKDGQSQIYILNADGSGLRRLMSSSGIDTEANWSPDGNQIYFTSDRGGSPQIYRVNADGSGVQRMSFNGAYNVSPRISPDGKTLVYVSRNEGRFQVTMQDLATQQVQALTDSQRDESPSFAPDGRTLLYATEVGGRGVLAVTSIDGRTRYRLNNRAGDVREPAWGPFEK